MSPTRATALDENPAHRPHAGALVRGIALSGLKE
jgi:hypothetical protein